MTSQRPHERPLAKMAREKSSRAGYFGLRLTPQGRLVWYADDDAPSLNEAAATRLGDAFAQGNGQGLLQLGAGEVGAGIAAGARLVAWIRGAIRVGFVPAGRFTAGRSGARRWRPRRAGARGADDDGGGIPVARRAARPVEGAGTGGCRIARGRRHRPPDLPEAPQPGLEPGGARALQPGREPPRCGGAVRLHGDLHDPAFGAGPGSASSARPSPARLCRRGKPR